jgi:hypothetical protein
VDFLSPLLFSLSLCLSAATGIRLLGAARRTRGLPEGLFGGANLMITAGAALDALALLGNWSNGRALLAGGAHASYSGAAMLTLLGTHLMFRQSHAWARYTAGLGATLLGCGALAPLALDVEMDAQGRFLNPLHSFLYLAELAVRGGAYAWLAVEAHDAYRRGCRAIKFGLVDALSVHQLLLWTFAAGVMTAGIVLSLVVRSLGGGAVPTTVVGRYAFAVIGVIGSGCSWLAFFPPMAYRRWVERAVRDDD